MATATSPYTIEEVDAALERKLRDIDIRMARQDLLAFTQYTFPTGFETNWHHEIMCREIDDWLVAEEPYNLALNLPRRHSKSEICSRHLPAYIFGRWPDKHIIAASYGASLIEGMSRECQKIMSSPEYAVVFPGTLIPTKGKRWDESAVRRADEFTIQGRRGHYVCAGVDGPLIGHGGHIGLIDDPIKNRPEAESKTTREKCVEWYRSTFRTSMEQGGRILMLTTRWHTDDLEGYVIKQMRDNPGGDHWKIISFPAIFEEGEFTHPDDPRKEGEALWPWKKTAEELNQIRIEGGSYNWASMWQQRPSPPGGNKIKRHWLQRIHRRDLPLNMQWVRFWDLAVTANTRADYTASGMMAIDENGNVYIDHLVREQVEWPDAQKMIKAHAVQEAVPMGITTTGMQKGFFQALLKEPEMLDVAVYGYNEVKDKYTRAIPWIARAEAGKFFIVEGPGVDTYIDELVEFTGKDDTHDDQVDWTSGAYQMFVGAVDAGVEIIGEYQV
jgi:predicted phage terminase large subunit-like protein